MYLKYKTNEEWLFFHISIWYEIKSCISMHRLSWSIFTAVFFFLFTVLFNCISTFLTLEGLRSWEILHVWSNIFCFFFLNDLVLCLFVCFVLIHTEMTLIAGLLITETMEGVFHCLLSSAIWGNWRELWLSHPDPLESPNQHKCQYVTSSGKGRNNSEIFCYLLWMD